MNFISAKNRRRLLQIAGFAIRSLSLPISNFIISLMVIRLADVALWGEFVYVFIIVNLASHIMAWGNVTHLFKEFSKAPAKIAALWQTNIASRALFFLPFGLICYLLPISGNLKWMIFIWAVTIFLFKAFDVYIFYHRKYTFSTILEICGTVLFVLLLLYFRESLNVPRLISIFTLVTFLKFAAAAIAFRRSLLQEFSFRVEISDLAKSFPFFLPPFLGIVQTKTDLYCVAYFLSTEEVGQYQIFVNLLFNLQSIASFLIGPFIKNLFRLPDNSLEKLTRVMIKIGTLGLIPAMGMMYLVIHFVYQFQLDITMYIAGYLFSLPFFIYVIKLYDLFKHDRQSAVVYITIAAGVMNLLLNIWLIHEFGMKGALFASAIVQWVLLVAFFRLKA